MLYIFCLFLLSVPPENVQILDELEAHIDNYRLGPYNEGASVNLTCISHGGKYLFGKYPLHYI